MRTKYMQIADTIIDMDEVLFVEPNYTFEIFNNNSRRPGKSSEAIMLDMRERKVYDSTSIVVNFKNGSKTILKKITMDKFLKLLNNIDEVIK